MILRRGRLFTVRVGHGALAPVAAVDVSKDSGESRPCHELFVVRDRVLVVGLSDSRGETGIDVFAIDRQGRLRRDARYEFRFEEDAIALVGERLVLYGAEHLRTPPGMPAIPFPSMRRLDREGRGSGFMPIALVRNVFRRPGASPPPGRLSVLEVTVCAVVKRPWGCRAKVVLGADAPERIHVSRSAAYLWASRGKAWSSPLAPSMDTASATLYRIPFDGGAPQAVGVAGSPLYYSESFFEDPAGTLNVFVRGDSAGSMMWYPDTVRGNSALLQLPRDAFGDGSLAAPVARYRWLPSDRTGSLRAAFLNRALLYAVGDSLDEGRTRRSTLYVVPLAGGGIASLALPHAAEIFAPAAGRVIVAGTDGRGFQLSELEVTSGVKLARRFELDSAALGARRASGVFGRWAPSTSGLIGVPFRSAFRGNDDDVFELPAAVFFFRGDSASFRTAGEFAVPRDTTGPERFASWCVEWFGSARPFFLGDRVLAVVGQWIVEGVAAGGGIEETRRVRFDRRSAGPRHTQ